MRNITIVVIISLFGFFVHFEILGQTGNLLLKIILFFGLCYILYQHIFDINGLKKKNQKPEEIKTTPKPSPTPKKQITLSNKEKSNLNTLLNDSSLSLNSFLLSQFDILYNFFLPTNGYIFIQNNEEDLRLFYKVIKPGTEWRDSSVQPTIIKLLKNHTSEILVENNLKQNSNILPYYSPENYSPGSVLAFNNTITDNQKLIWIFDSPATGYFNEEEFKVLTQVGFSTHYTIANALKQKYYGRLLTAENKKFELSRKLNTCPTYNQLVSIFIEYIAELFEAHKLTIAMVDSTNTQMATVIKTVGIIDSVKTGSRFSISEGLCGKVITNNQIYLLDDIEKDDYFIPRFSKNEKTNYGLHSFLALPLLKNSQPIGLIVLEYKSPGFYTIGDKEKLREYCTYLSEALSRFISEQYLELKQEENN